MKLLYLNFKRSGVNEWEEKVALLVLKDTLTDEALECNCLVHLAGVLEALRARYDLSPRQAQLASLRCKYCTPSKPTELKLLTSLRLFTQR